jgi:very-short-patch-repair endonuclease
MLLMLLLIVAIALATVFLLAAKLQRREPSGEWPYYAKKPLSAVEQVLYFRLVRALPDKIILAQVGLSRLLGVKRGNNYAAWFNRISRMSADFVVCAKDSTILAVIELDDATHERSDRKTADEKKDRALTAAGLRIVRVQAKALPDEAAIKSLFSAAEGNVRPTSIDTWGSR